MTIERRCQGIELILSDVDGVLTDGSLILDSNGVELKQFHIRDGLGIKLWQRAGGRFGIITGRTSHNLHLRATELGVHLLRQGVDKKLKVFQEMLAELNLQPAQVCYIGDDLPDLPVIQAAGLGVAVADAVPEVRTAAQFVTSLPGGKGAVRELVELILKAQRRWEQVLQLLET